MQAKLDRRAVLKGIAGASMALPVLNAMGAEVADQTPRRFCAVYTANGMSLPKSENKIDEWSWFPRQEENGEFVFGQSTKPFEPFRERTSASSAECFTRTGPRRTRIFVLICG